MHSVAKVIIRPQLLSNLEEVCKLRATQFGKDTNNVDLPVLKVRCIFWCLDLLGSRTDLLLQVINDSLSLPGALVFLNVLPLVPEDLKGREALDLVLRGKRLVLLVVGINFSKNDRRIVLAKQLSCLLILWCQAFAVSTPEK